MNKQSRIWELLAKKEAREATFDELAELDTLLQSQTLPKLDDALNYLKDYCISVRMQPDEALLQRAKIYLEKYYSKLSDEAATEDNVNISQGKRKSIFLKYWWSIAAVILLFIGIKAIYLVLHPDKAIEIAVAKGAKKIITLPDGTKVWLNGGSSISYPADYLTSKSREITLLGEACFDVKHNAARPFIIHTEYGINIRDIGTIFNVKAYPEDKTLETTLLQGSVEIFNDKMPESSLLLRPKEKFTYFENKNIADKKGSISEQTGHTVSSGTIASRNFEISRIDPLLNRNGDSIISETAWTRGELAFDAETFADLANKMARWYNVNITIQDSVVAAYRFTGVFDGETLTQALDELKMIRSFSYSASNNVIYIKE